MTQSKASILPTLDFIEQNLLVNDEPWSYGDADNHSLFENGAFPEGTEIRPYDPKVKSDLISPTWIAFPEYPFTLGLKYSFSGLIAEFFETTKISYI